MALKQISLGSCIGPTEISKKIAIYNFECHAKVYPCRFSDGENLEEIGGRMQSIYLL